jgi:hypothetical protein
MAEVIKTILEIYYLRIVGKSVRYQRKEGNLSRKGGDPDRMIQTLIYQKHQDKAEGMEAKEFIVHSTSWRYEQPGKVMLTYVAYSDELEFEKGKAKSLPLTKLRAVAKKSRKPRSQAELEKKVVSHAMRHIAFLIKTNNQIDFKSAMTSDTMEIFEELWVSLAGKIF